MGPEDEIRGGQASRNGGGRWRGKFKLMSSIAGQWSEPGLSLGMRKPVCPPPSPRTLPRATLEAKAAERSRPPTVPGGGKKGV